MKYYLYARKSTEEDSQQVLSIEAQLVELKEFAAKEKLVTASGRDPAFIRSLNQSGGKIVTSLRSV
ncbi:MAG: hypothetical protein HYY50_02020 [Candidatus Kerfeldbacteria bacterium]|nr:hypothetical protein [Candidatus Kerfeldbacteria bacterium]